MKLYNLLREGRYDSVVTQLSNIILQQIKKSTVAFDNNGLYNGDLIYFENEDDTLPIHDNDYPDIWSMSVENDKIPLEFIIQLRVKWIQDFGDYRIGADAYNSQTKNPETADLPLIELRFELDPIDVPNIYSEIAMDLRDMIRHEIEHLTQSGWNLIPSKYMSNDQKIRKKINSGELPVSRYFTLPMEIHANLQGLYFKAKKSKKPFSDIVHQYLDLFISAGHISNKEKLHIIKVWKKYLPKLGIKAEIN